MMEEVAIEDTPLMRPQLKSQDSATAISDEDPPDPRIQIELERLNTSTDLINKLEVDLDEARMMFRQTLLESTQRIDNLTKKLGKCVDQARPYYEARIKAKQALTEAQKSAVRYERAVSQHAAAREMVQLAEEGLLTRGCIFDSTWQEMLNHATTKVNDAEREKIESTGDHKEKSNKYHESETRVKFLQKELKRSIAKSSLNARRSLLQLSNIIRMQELQLLPYFELKAGVNQRLEEQKRHVRDLETAVASAKANYSQALTNLETISDQIHKTRQTRVDLGIRGVGVGAESPGPPFGTGSEAEIGRQKASEESSIFLPKVIQKKSGSSQQQSIPPQPTTNAPSLVSTTSPALVATTSTTVDLTTSTTHKAKRATVLTKGEEDEGAACRTRPSHDTKEKKEREEEEELLSATPPPVAVATPDLPSSKGEDDASTSSQAVAGVAAKTGDEGGDVPCDAAEQQAGSFLSGWQFVAIPGVPQSGNQSLLSVDDRESIVSDSESLTSIEMLSEEAIANLMLEDEINEATHSICSFSDEFLAPPPPPPKGGSSVPLSAFAPASSAKRGRGDESERKHEGKSNNSNSQASSSDSGGEPWEVVSDGTQDSSEGKKGLDPSSPSNDASAHRSEKSEKKDQFCSALKSSASRKSFIPPEREACAVTDIASFPDMPLKSGSSSDAARTSPALHKEGAAEANRPQTLSISPRYPLSSDSSSTSHSTSTSNSLSEEFSPSYAPLGDTPDVENGANGTTTAATQHRVPTEPDLAIRPPDNTR